MNLKLNSCPFTPLNCLNLSLVTVVMIAMLPALPASASPLLQQKEKSATKSEKQDEETSELVTVRGQFELDTELVKEFDWDTMTAQLIEVVVLQQAKLPDGWDKMSREQRNEWANEFQASDAGKKLAEANQKILTDRTVLDITIRDGGRFIVYDVPKGRFDLRAVAQHEIGERTYVLQ